MSTSFPHPPHTHDVFDIRSFALNHRFSFLCENSSTDEAPKLPGWEGLMMMTNNKKFKMLYSSSCLLFPLHEIFLPDIITPSGVANCKSCN